MRFMISSKEVVMRGFPIIFFKRKKQEGVIKK
jgi:hypothetical protein